MGGTVREYRLIVRKTLPLLRRSFPLAGLAASLLACGGGAARLKASTDPSFANIVAPKEDGDDNVPAVAPLAPGSGAERAAAGEPDADDPAGPDRGGSEAAPSDASDSQD